MPIITLFRLQRHFATFAVVLPGEDSLFTIYNTILSDHFEVGINYCIYYDSSLHLPLTLSILLTSCQFIQKLGRFHLKP